MYARMANKTPFVVYQGAWSILQRDFERDIIPMALEEGEWCPSLADISQLTQSPKGMALAPWNVLAGGKIRTDAEEERRRQTGEKGASCRSEVCGKLGLMDVNHTGRMSFGPEWERTADQRTVCLALEKVAGEVGAKSITAGAS